MSESTTAGTRAHLALTARQFGVPEHLIEGLVRYAIDGIRPGGFLCACLANDLWGAAGRADPQSRPALAAIVSFIVNHVPGRAVGSYVNIDNYVALHAAKRQAAPTGVTP